MKLNLAALLLLTFFNVFAFADQEEPHDLVRRIVVFPLEVEPTYAKIAETVWWDLREKLSESKRFLIASKNFMQSKDVFQARGKLEPADAIILSRLLEANALITTALRDRLLTMHAYDGRRGQLLWQQSIELHPSIPVSKQLPESARKLMFDFIASIPYQGFVITDALIGRAAVKDGDFYTVLADVGEGSGIQVGDVVQILQFKAQSVSPSFQGGLTAEVLAEGVVNKIDKTIASLRIERIKDPDQIKEKSFVRLPNEFKRLRETYIIDSQRNQGAELRYLEMGPELTEKQKEKKPLVTAVSFFANLALILAIAF